MHKYTSNKPLRQKRMPGSFESDTTRAEDYSLRALCHDSTHSSYDLMGGAQAGYAFPAYLQSNQFSPITDGEVSLKHLEDEFWGDGAKDMVVFCTNLVETMSCNRMAVESFSSWIDEPKDVEGVKLDIGFGCDGNREGYLKWPHYERMSEVNYSSADWMECNGKCGGIRYSEAEQNIANFRHNFEANYNKQDRANCSEQEGTNCHLQTQGSYKEYISSHTNKFNLGRINTLRAHVNSVCTSKADICKEKASGREDKENHCNKAEQCIESGLCSDSCDTHCNEDEYLAHIDKSDTYSYVGDLHDSKSSIYDSKSGVYDSKNDLYGSKSSIYEGKSNLHGNRSFGCLNRNANFMARNDYHHQACSHATESNGCSVLDNRSSIYLNKGSIYADRSSATTVLVNPNTSLNNSSRSLNHPSKGSSSSNISFNSPISANPNSIIFNSSNTSSSNTSSSNILSSNALHSLNNILSSNILSNKSLANSNRSPSHSSSSFAHTNTLDNNFIYPEPNHTLPKTTSPTEKDLNLPDTILTTPKQEHLYDLNFSPKLFNTSISPNFRISIEAIEKDLDKRTTCMIKNIPNKYTQRMLIDLLNEEHFGTFNFVYLRMDFKNKCNVGYAFVNFNNHRLISSFYRKINGKGWKKFSSGKIAELAYASIQGLESLKKKFKRSTVMLEQESYRPKLFYSSGPLQGQEKPSFM